jgi:integrase
MASLRKRPRSPFWFACITLADGRRVQRSTKEKSRKAAQAKADEWETLAKERAKARQAHRVIADIYKAAHKTELPDATTGDFLDGWLQRRKGEIAPASFAAYSHRILHFKEWLGDFAGRPLAEIETSHIIRYRDALAERISPATCNAGIKVLRAVFEDARRDGYISDNPAKDCGMMKKSAGTTRRPFTVEELKRILAAASEEWRSMILFGLYTGQRLGDIARMTWQNVDLVEGEVSIRTAKTGRLVRIPLASPLLAHLERMPAGDDPKAFIHPRAAKLARVRTGSISNQFSELLASIGITGARTHGKAGNGRAARRAASELSFHSLRHTATSLMKNAGISPAIVQDIIGHESAEISAHYTHIESDAKRQALSALPDLTAL